MLPLKGGRRGWQGRSSAETPAFGSAMRFGRPCAASAVGHEAYTNLLATTTAVSSPCADQLAGWELQLTRL